MLKSSAAVATSRATPARPASARPVSAKRLAASSRPAAPSSALKRVSKAACRLALVAAAASGEGGLSGAPAGWELATRVSGDALAMMGEGDVAAAEIILKKGMAEIEEQHPNDPSVALLCTQLWNIHQEQGSYAAALEQARRAYDLMIGHFGEDSADAAFHGIRLGISLICNSQELDRAQELLVYGGQCAQHNLEIFWTRLQESEAAGQPPEMLGELAVSTKKLMVALAECNFYGAIGIVRKAIRDADELEIGIQDLQEAWMGGVKQMAMALPPEHQMFEIALRELGRVVPDAAGRPALQAELEGTVQGLRELLYLIKNLPDDWRQQMEQQQEPGEGGDEAPFLP